MKNNLLSEYNQFSFSLMGDFKIKRYSNKCSSGLTMKLYKGINIIMILEGEGYISYDDRNIKYSKDNLVWFNQLCDNSLEIKPVKDHLEFVYYGFCEEIMNKNVRLKVSGGFLSTEYMTLKIGKLLRGLILQSLYLPCKSISRELFILGKAMEIISLITYQICGFNDYFEENAFRHDNKIKKVKEILMEEYQDPPDLNELANRIGINTKKLTKKFREQNGKSIYEWLQEYRLQMAYCLICCNFGNISKVASEIGYTTSHFCSVFKRKYGISPGDLKNTG
ncbi:TPA: helix-turn-helix transcriptional regulator [Salmonella enterica subsp. enterica serovar Muenchen]|nr:AraC family transcriptional regulator [Salmonella enterica subsp. enterica serovar Muenchen]ECZ0254981.1 helix-turn-helix transcriptional regulator [Salmonella enterica subsp. diarizonae]EJR0735170.1 helix-turn-helix transcriptional regulator [Salmonella enterica]EIG0950314.1 helix-turn-helix transcriptional regulator [Salmonella enterica subsp. enterica serovar Muenchen]ELZ0449513.1 helix-turn-helix transcriptional regulator [Salmonella enterica]